MLKNQPGNPPKANKKAEYYEITRLFLSTSCLQKTKKHFFLKNRRKNEKKTIKFRKKQAKFKKIENFFAISKFKNDFQAKNSPISNFLAKFSCFSKLFF